MSLGWKISVGGAGTIREGWLNLVVRTQASAGLQPGGLASAGRQCACMQAPQQRAWSKLGSSAVKPPYQLSPGTGMAGWLGRGG